MFCVLGTLMSKNAEWSRRNASGRSPERIPGTEIRQFRVSEPEGLQSLRLSAKTLPARPATAHRRPTPFPTRR